MISVSKVSKTYGDGDAQTRVLKNVSLEIEAGEFVAIIGTSGSGKTTLLNVVGGLDREFTGDVSVNGAKISGLPEAKLAEMRNTQIGFVFQQFNLLDHLTAAENVALPSFFSPKETADAERRAVELLERVGLSGRSESNPTQLSGGQKQRVAIARSLFCNPQLLLCDEPTGSLDRNTGVEILNIFRKLNEDDGLTLIMVTHEEHIARMARRIIRFEDGEIVSDKANKPSDPSRRLQLGEEE